MWVLFGTGRLWSNDDLLPCQGAVGQTCDENHKQYIYGVKEPVNSQGFLSFDDLTSKASSILDLSGANVYQDGSITSIKSQPTLIQTGTGGASDFDSVTQAVLGSKTIGYRRLLNAGTVLNPAIAHNYERLLSQPKLVSTGSNQSLMTFTTFEPGGTTCGDLGLGYMYLVDTFTGLPNPKTYPLFIDNGSTPPSSGTTPQLVTGAISTGDGKPTESTVLSVDDKYIIRTSGPDGSIFDMELSSKNALDSRLSSWREVRDLGFEMTGESMIQDIP
jgi:Tfp pilus tip-associated adhesin PilY1